MESRVLGVDFSGAGTAERSTWLTEARHVDDGLVVEECYRAAEAFGVGRESAHAGVRSRATGGFAVVGLDVPFSLPQALLDEHCGGSWRELVEWVGGDPGRFRDAYEGSHDALDSLVAAVSAGRVGSDPPLHGSHEEGHIYV